MWLIKKEFTIVVTYCLCTQTRTGNTMSNIWCTNISFRITLPKKWFIGKIPPLHYRKYLKRTHNIEKWRFLIIVCNFGVQNKCILNNYISINFPKVIYYRKFFPIVNSKKIILHVWQKFKRNFYEFPISQRPFVFYSFYVVAISYLEYRIWMLRLRKNIRHVLIF